MTRLQEASEPGPTPARVLRGGKVLLTGPTGRAVTLTQARLRAYSRGEQLPPAALERLCAAGIIPDARRNEELAREQVESGLLNWRGPASHVVFTSGGGRVMDPQQAKTVVDFIFSTPRPVPAIEVVDEDGTGWSAANFIFSYARRRAEWSGRGLMLSWRARQPVAPERAEILRNQGAAVRAALLADGPPPGLDIFTAPKALVAVSPRAQDPSGWVRALSGAGYCSVEWTPTPDNGGARFASFAARAFAAVLELDEHSDLRDDAAIGLLRGRPWEVRGVDILETLCFGPDADIYSSERGFRARGASGASPFWLGRIGELRFQDLLSVPAAAALIAAAVSRRAQPLCSACVYESYCVVPPSANFAAQGSLSGRAPDSPDCRVNMAILDVIFSCANDKKVWKKIEKWGVDISRPANYNL